MTVKTNNLFPLRAVVFALSAALLCAGCEAPAEQKAWGSREGGLNLAAKAEAPEPAALENRSGGLNLAPR